METITFNLHTGHHLLGYLIRFFSRGVFNHTSILINNTIYEAHINTGVRKISVYKWSDKSVVRSVTFQADSHTINTIQLWLDEQIGKKYDLLGVLSFLWIFFKPQSGKWFCSEISIVVLMKLFNITQYDQRQSPTGFYFILMTITSLINNSEKNDIRLL